MGYAVKAVKILQVYKDEIINFTNLNMQKCEKINFLHDSLKDEICFCQIDNNRQIYSFFDCYFLVISDDMVISDDGQQNTKQRQKFFKYHSDFSKKDEYFAYLFNESCSDEIISMAIRNSKTLKIGNENSYDNSDLKAVFDTKAFVVFDKFSNDTNSDKFKKFILLFMLALAYNQKIVQFLQATFIAYKSNDFNKMLKIRDSLLAFDLGLYFDNPVKPTRNQLYKIYKIISNQLTTKDTHNELKSQISNLTQVIYEKQKDIQDKKLTTIGILIGIASLITSIITIFK